MGVFFAFEAEAVSAVAEGVDDAASGELDAFFTAGAGAVLEMLAHVDEIVD